MRLGYAGCVYVNCTKTHKRRNWGCPFSVCYMATLVLKDHPLTSCRDAPHTDGAAAVDLHPTPSLLMSSRSNTH